MFCAILAAMCLQSLAIQYDDGQIRVLDQQKLPSVEEWIDVETPEQMVDVIRALKVRGAPMIGLAAVLSLAQMEERGASVEEIRRAAALLKESRPTAVNLSIYLKRVLEQLEMGRDVRSTAMEIFHEDTKLCQKMGEAGAAIIEEGEQILTICNTGSLATAGIGTALGVIREAHRQGKKIHVYACETRPLLQGGRLTAWELQKEEIPFTLICDSMAAMLMKQGKIDRVLVGADRIAANGDFANKIGTYSLAVLAHHHGIPFHVVAPYTTIDPHCPNGDAIVIEKRNGDEVRGYGPMIWSPKEAPVYNPAFDVTPAEFVESYILDIGDLSLQSFLRRL